jgi:uncharacterized protein (DUF697 family)
MSKPKAKLSPKDYEDIGRLLVDVYETGYVTNKRFYKQSFIKGVLVGLGGVIGATVVVTIILWVLTLFNSVPFVDQLSQNIHHTLQQNQNSVVKPAQ